MLNYQRVDPKNQPTSLAVLLVHIFVSWAKGGDINVVKKNLPIGCRGVTPLFIEQPIYRSMLVILVKKNICIYYSIIMYYIVNNSGDGKSSSRRYPIYNWVVAVEKENDLIFVWIDLQLFFWRIHCFVRNPPTKCRRVQSNWNGPATVCKGE